jgi:hypothetical protein
VVQHAYERLWYTITEALLAMTLFRDDLNTRFLALFTMLLVVKLFHWLAGDRVDVVRRPALPTLPQPHTRMCQCKCVQRQRRWGALGMRTSVPPLHTHEHTSG